MRCTPLSGAGKTGYNPLYGVFRLPEKTVQALYVDFPERKFRKIALYANFLVREIGVQGEKWSKRARKERTTRCTLFSRFGKMAYKPCTAISRSGNSWKMRCTSFFPSGKSEYNALYGSFRLWEKRVQRIVPRFPGAEIPRNGVVLRFSPPKNRRTTWNSFSALRNLKLLRVTLRISEQTMKVSFCRKSSTSRKLVLTTVSP